MFYRPAFCCNCGEKIQREEWRLWTSRRFCALCETEHKGIDLIPRAVVLIGLLLTVFGFGSYLRRTGNPAENPQLVRSTRPVANLKPAPPSSDGSGSVMDSNSNVWWLGPLGLTVLRILYVEARLTQARVKGDLLVFPAGLGMRLLFGVGIVGFSALVASRIGQEAAWLVLMVTMG